MALILESSESQEVMHLSTQLAIIIFSELAKCALVCRTHMAHPDFQDFLVPLGQKQRQLSAIESGRLMTIQLHDASPIFCSDVYCASVLDLL